MKRRDDDEEKSKTDKRRMKKTTLNFVVYKFEIRTTFLITCIVLSLCYKTLTTDAKMFHNFNFNHFPRNVLHNIICVLKLIVQRFSPNMKVNKIYIPKNIEIPQKYKLYFQELLIRCLMER